jgi:ubiquinone/menaquinone biosynthesis C-methylase UbiE
MSSSPQKIESTHSRRKQAIKNISDRVVSEYDHWLPKKHYFQQEDLRYLQFLIPKGLKILDLGCGLGDKLAALKPSVGVGVDFSSLAIDKAKATYPHLSFIQSDIEDPMLFPSLEGPFDIILISDTIGFLEDCQETLSQLQTLCTNDTRLVISYYSRLWDPIIKLAELSGQKIPQPENNYLSTTDISNLLRLSGFRAVKREWRQLLPKYWAGMGPFINRYIATLPGIRRLCLRNYIVARMDHSNNALTKTAPSTSVIITCRNEKGNVEEAIKRLPQFCEDLEIIFVEGHSKDGTLEEIHRVKEAYPQLNIHVLVQEGCGKGDAVRKGFQHASKDILMILDGDLTTPPEDMPKFYSTLARGQGEFINGTRLIYPMENQAMQFLNHIANTVFSWIFTYLLNQRFTDTLCGTKVLYKKHYENIAKNRDYFGDFDPFGDFDLIFGACKLNLEVIEVPVRYRARTYGSTQISRFQHGWLLLKMVVFAYRKLKAL